MGDSATGNRVTRRQFMAALAAGTASFAAHVVGARAMRGAFLPKHESITISDELPKPVPPPPKKAFPDALRAMMGPDKARLFENDAGLVVREYDVTETELREFLIQKTGPISEAASLAGKHYPAAPAADLCYISAGLFVAGWVHGVDPYLMHAIAHVESNFSNNTRSRAGAMGCMQVTLNSAIFELHSMNRWRNAAEQKLRGSLKKLGGRGFFGLADEPVIALRNGRFRLSQKDDDVLMSRPLPNAVWGARTLLLKYRGGRMEPRDWQSEREKVKGLLRRYKGIDARAEMYANNAYHYYRNVYSRLDRPGCG